MTERYGLFAPDTLRLLRIGTNLAHGGIIVSIRPHTIVSVAMFFFYPLIGTVADKVEQKKSPVDVQWATNL